MADHGHRIVSEACIGCIACAKVCPTKAIRVRDDLAGVISELCIDCGACVRTCQYNAAQPATSPPSDLKKFKYTVALPSLTLYGQFGKDVDPDQVLRALTEIGFDRTYDISWMCEMIAAATDAYLTECKGPWPKISATCPAIVRLIQIRYPALIDNIIPLETPRELSAKLLRRKLSTQMKLAPEEIGLFFITPCTAIMNSILNPVGLEQSYLDGALSIRDVYSSLFRATRQRRPAEIADGFSPRGLLWAMAGGEISGMRSANTLTVRGVPDVEYVFDHIEAGKFQSVDFIEAYICPDGCVSGGLTVEGRYAAQRNIQEIVKRLSRKAETPAPGRVQEEKVRSLLREHFFDLEEEINARPIQPLAADLRRAIALKREQAAILQQLPHKDCAACGAPDCVTLAEDIVRGEAALDDCVFIKIQRLEQQLHPRKDGEDEQA
jgi:Fe-S-cluster-containing hydrogenase component 2